MAFDNGEIDLQAELEIRLSGVTPPRDGSRRRTGPKAARSG